MSQGPQSAELACPGPGPLCPADSSPLGVPFSHTPPPLSFTELGDCSHQVTVVPLAAWTHAWCLAAPTSLNPGLRTAIRASGPVPVAGGLLESLTSGLAPGPGGQGAQSLPLVLGSQPRGPPPHAFWQALRVCQLEGAGQKGPGLGGGHVDHCSCVFPCPHPRGRPPQTLLGGLEPDAHRARDLAASLLSGARVHCMSV